MDLSYRLYKACQSENVWKAFLEQIPEIEDIEFSFSVISGIKNTTTFSVYYRICCSLLENKVITDTVFTDCCKLMSEEEKITYVNSVDYFTYNTATPLILRTLSLSSDVLKSIITRYDKRFRSVLRIAFEREDSELLKNLLDLKVCNTIYYFTKALREFSKSNLLEVLYQHHTEDTELFLHNLLWECYHDILWYIIQFVSKKSGKSIKEIFTEEIIYMEFEHITAYNKAGLSITEIREINEKLDDNVIKEWLEISIYEDV